MLASALQEVILQKYNRQKDPNLPSFGMLKQNTHSKQHTCTAAASGRIGFNTHTPHTNHREGGGTPYISYIHCRYVWPGKGMNFEPFWSERVNQILI